MSDPKRLTVCGDLHGNVHALVYLYETAYANNVDAIIQVGDFGYWEHARGGPEFLDSVRDLANETGIPLYWIDGNHENHTLLRQRYADSEKTREGFWTIRDGCYYIPRGTRWEWSGRQLMGLGGAYSIDKDYRIARERGTTCYEWGLYQPSKPLGHRTMWWPEEETTDDDVAFALRDKTPLDILFTHGKPRASNPSWNRKDFPDCYPNQDRIQTVVRELTPKLLVHGHLHFSYEDQIRCGDGQSFTHVIGLGHDKEYQIGNKTTPNDMVATLTLVEDQAEGVA